MNNLELVIDLPFLAREINDAHRQVTFHGKSIIVEARRAGDALLAAKKDVPHGGFADWVKANCLCSYRQAMKYMRVAKIASQGNFELTGGIDAFLDMAATPRPEEPQAAREFTRADAERVFKLHALATRGGTPAECEAASGKLSNFAREFGMTPEAAVAKAREFLPDHEKTDFEREREAVRKRNAERQAAHDAEVKATRDELAKAREALERISRRREEIRKELSTLSREELLDVLVAERVAKEAEAMGL